MKLPRANEITIDSIRELKSNLSISAPELKKKVVIISEAEKLNLESQNALLKILEEPNDDILFILETDNIESLLSTIKSRCWIINFGPPTYSQIKEFFFNRFNHKIDQNILQTLIKKYSNDNLCELFDLFLNLITTEKSLNETDSENSIDFIELFRYLYLGQFNKALSYFDSFNLLSDRKAALQVTAELLKFCYLVLKTKISQENKTEELIKLSKVIDETKFKVLIDHLTNYQNYIENYINLNLLWIQIFLLIHKSFIKNK